MAKAKIHYRSTAGDDVVELNRVAATCGAITQHSTPQLMVKETANEDLITCGNCFRRLMTGDVK